MADGNENPTTPPPTGTQAAPATPPSTPGPDTVVLTRAELDAMLEQKANSAAAAARREAEGRLKPAAPPPTAPRHQEAPAASTQNTVNVADEVARAVQRESAFTRAVTQAGLDAAQESILRTLMSAEQVSDVSQWVTEKAKAFGKTTTQHTMPSTPTTPPHAAPQSPSVPPATSVTNDGPDDVVTWNEEQWLAYVRRNGANPGNPYHWSNRKVHAELAQKYAASMANRRIVTK